MCGINAIVGYGAGAPPVNPDELIASRDAMAPRGPDAVGQWVSTDGRVGMGHRRLAIIDLSPTGIQPMHEAEAELTIVFNGEIYNYKELRDGLIQKGEQFRGGSDTEVMLKLYKHRGPDFVRELRGMFTLVLWDGRRQGVLMARDPFGIKPLYYTDDGRTLRAASQVNALLAGGAVSSSPEPAGHVGFLLWGYVPEPYTIHRALRALPAGSTLWVDRAGRREARQFFALSEEIAAAEHAASPMDWRAALGPAIADSVRHHLVADVPVGVFLSAGLDSTTIASHAAAASTTALRTVTLGFDAVADSTDDETLLAETVAASLRAEHRTRRISARDFRDNFDRLLHAMDQPSVDGINTYFVARETAATGLKVALSGVGGDELFGTYPSYREIPQAVAWLAPFARLPVLPRLFRRMSAPVLARLTSPKYAGMFEYGGDYGGTYLLRRGLFMPWELPDLIDADMARVGWRELATLARLEDQHRAIRQGWLKVMALEMSWYMRDQLLRDADWAGMAHGLEIRTPLVDVALFRALLPHLVSERRPSKREMALTSKPALPAAVLDRPKTGFVVPVRDWLVAGGQAPPARGLRGWARLVHDRFAGTPS